MSRWREDVGGLTVIVVWNQAQRGCDRVSAPSRTSAMDISLLNFLFGFYAPFRLGRISRLNGKAETRGTGILPCSWPCGRVAVDVLDVCRAVLAVWKGRVVWAQPLCRRGRRYVGALAITVPTTAARRYCLLKLEDPSVWSTTTMRSTPLAADLSSAPVATADDDDEQLSDDEQCCHISKFGPVWWRLAGVTVWCRMVNASLGFVWGS
ncbi:hypothetical protein BDZ89DRAFT_1120193 [Hymenopellis radicata]|nr:hypothetical protein BDZ89DRAFT_1120193 [Hymenopellis radicata]